MIADKIGVGAIFVLPFDRKINGLKILLEILSIQMPLSLRTKR